MFLDDNSDDELYLLAIKINEEEEMVNEGPQELLSMYKKVNSSYNEKVKFIDDLLVQNEKEKEELYHDIVMMPNCF